MLRRRTELKPSRGTTIPDKVRARVNERDRRCVGWVVGMPGLCAGQLELDHVRASGGLGLKSPSTVENLVRLCALHHEVKTLSGREWRPVLIGYIEGKS
jgi:hypothetical protein